MRSDILTSQYLKLTMCRHSAILPGVSDVNYEGSVTEEKTGERNIS